MSRRFRLALKSLAVTTALVLAQAQIPAHSTSRAAVMHDQVHAVGTLSNFHDVVVEESSHRLVVVDFWAPWCSPCLTLTQVLIGISSEHPNEMRLVTINYDEEPELVRELGVDTLPAVILFRNGVAVAEFRRARSEDQVRKFLTPHIG